MVGLNFADEQEASNFLLAVNMQLYKLLNKAGMFLINEHSTFQSYVI